MKVWLRGVQPVMRFAGLALLLVVALGVVLGRALNTDVQQRYLDASQNSATLLTQVGVQPLLTAQELSHGLTADQVAAIDQKLQGASFGHEVRRLKVWNPTGMIVYSDNHALIDRTFAIDDDLHDALGGIARASITDGHDEENTGDNLTGPLVQVYVPLIFQGNASPSGAFELYLPYAPVQSAIDRESQQLYVFLGAGLTLLYLLIVPLVYLAIRWQRRAEAAAIANLAVLERLNRLKSEFLVGISHQFRTAMVGIKGFSELIGDADHLDLEEVKAFAKDIHGDAVQLDHAFEKMIEIDANETRRPTTPADRINLADVAKQVAEASRNLS